MDLNKGKAFIREGEKPKNFAFVIKELFRYYYLDSNGNEFTKGFIPENSFLISYSALIEKRASYFSIQALENSSILVIDYQKWKELEKNSIHWTRFLLSIVEKAFCKKENREREFLLFNAKDRYKSFLNTFPGIEGRVKQHLIAITGGSSGIGIELAKVLAEKKNTIIICGRSQEKSKKAVAPVADISM